MRKLSSNDRSALIRLASAMPVGSPERKTILAGLTRKASDVLGKLEAVANTRLKPGRNNILGYPIDLPDQEGGDLLYFYPVDADAAMSLINELRALRFKVRFDKSDKSIVLT